MIVHTAPADISLVAQGQGPSGLMTFLPLVVIMLITTLVVVIARLCRRRRR